MGAALGSGCLGDAGRVGGAEGIAEVVYRVAWAIGSICQSKELPPWVGLPSPPGSASLTLGQVNSCSSEGDKWRDWPWLCDLEQVTSPLWAAVISVSNPQEVD